MIRRFNFRLRLLPSVLVAIIAVSVLAALVGTRVTPIYARSAIQSSPASQASPGPSAKTINVISRATAINNFIDTGPQGPSTGDLYVFRDNLFDAAQPNIQVGHADGRCILIDPSAQTFGCTIISAFADGIITTEGTLTLVAGTTSTGAITGGTGAYRTARGEGTLLLGPFEGPHQVTFSVILHP